MPRRKSPERRRAEILLESITFFSEHGFAGSTHDLAKQIGITQPLLFRYFQSKEELAEAVYDAVFNERWHQDWPEWIRDRTQPLRERLKRFYDSYLKTVFNRDWMRLYIYAGLSDILINRRYLTRLEREILLPLCSELRSEFKMPSPETLPITNDELDFVWSFHGGIFYHGIRRCAFGTSTDHDLSDQLLEVLIDGLIDAAPHAMARFLSSQSSKKVS